MGNYTMMQSLNQRKGGMIILRQHQFQKSEYYQTASMWAAKYFISSRHRTNTGKLTIESTLIK